jgi:hypothetical protein
MGEHALHQRVPGGEEVQCLVEDGLLAIEGPEEARSARYAGQAVDDGLAAEGDRKAAPAAGARQDVVRM